MIKMKDSRDTSIHLVIALISDLLSGKRLHIGDDTIGMSDEGHIGYVFTKNGIEETIAGDMSVKHLAELVEEYDVITIP